MKHIVKIITLLVTICALWMGLLQMSFAPSSHTWLLPIYFTVLLGCYGLLMVGVGLMRLPTCPREAALLQQFCMNLEEASSSYASSVVSALAGHFGS
ncbi:dolichol-phosphate mannose synthase subunit 3-like isoform X1 [Punica granatum]|uniref:Dolichol-phosphate mannosyltransferase subunit 3 n=1 Tax=Punica granatum TaxID=22663 RepID=A0A6P8DK34_PUNGR|nr:dolichol-phosphate mannose synthase subunit 3-like isoform X1 [Punica granatum]XP_031397725.1 dolichol-phosphate mannose synthase subunit 3-like isoform X1 [Punica granatum]XP_031397726.1 dolichol-phosphate mannose synthase subunit 3-like isoform X1 [Punica granatum]XP_031397727.1 dolichol-phosphate mannose synthase subunit 3-like isoform X1 [Punica granatum]